MAGTYLPGSVIYFGGAFYGTSEGSRANSQILVEKNLNKLLEATAWKVGLFARCAKSVDVPTGQDARVKPRLRTDGRLVCLVFCFHIFRVANETLLLPPLFSEEYFEPVPVLLSSGRRLHPFPLQADSRASHGSRNMGEVRGAHPHLPQQQAAHRSQPWACPPPSPRVGSSVSSAPAPRSLWGLSPCFPLV